MKCWVVAVGADYHYSRSYIHSHR